MPGVSFPPPPPPHTHLGGKCGQIGYLVATTVADGVSVMVLLPGPDLTAGIPSVINHILGSLVGLPLRAPGYPNTLFPNSHPVLILLVFAGVLESLSTRHLGFYLIKLHLCPLTASQPLGYTKLAAALRDPHKFLNISYPCKENLQPPPSPPSIRRGPPDAFKAFSAFHCIYLVSFPGSVTFRLHVCGGQRTPCGDQFFSYTQRVPGIEHRY